jgi:hypothetical protein
LFDHPTISKTIIIVMVPGGVKSIKLMGFNKKNIPNSPAK